jgi:hypothetical protein
MGPVLEYYGTASCNDEDVRLCILLTQEERGHILQGARKAVETASHLKTAKPEKQP